MDELQTLARAAGAYGEVVLRRRGTGDDAVTELIVNGVFAMDSADPGSERALGRLPFPFERARVLLGGLGLGYTALELLERDVRRLDVVELEPALVAWAEQRITVPLGRVAADPRVRLLVGDVADVVAGRNGDDDPWDAILLDVDNGPDFLIHDHNSRLYEPARLALAYERLAARGVLAIWCQGPSPTLYSALSEVDAEVRPEVGEYHHRHRRGTREWSYVIYTLQHP